MIIQFAIPIQSSSHAPRSTTATPHPPQIPFNDCPLCTGIQPFSRWIKPDSCYTPCPAFYPCTIAVDVGRFDTRLGRNVRDGHNNVGVERLCVDNVEIRVFLNDQCAILSASETPNHEATLTSVNTMRSLGLPSGENLTTLAASLPEVLLPVCASPETGSIRITLGF